MGRRDAASYSKQGRRSVLIFVAFLTVGGCKCADPKAEADALRARDLESLPHASGSLQDQLAAEAAGRPEGTATIEALQESLTRQGISFGGRRQGFAKKLLASYCGSVDSLDGMILTICEYPTPEQARRGQTETDIMGKVIAGYQSRVSKKSVLQLVARSTTAPENVAKVLSTFDAL